MFDKAEKILPYAALSGFLVSIIYAYGYFRYAGEEWLQSLTITDLFALAWAGAPTAIISYCISLFFTRPTPITSEGLVGQKIITPFISFVQLFGMEFCSVTNVAFVSGVTLYGPYWWTIASVIPVLLIMIVTITLIVIRFHDRVSPLSLQLMASLYTASILLLWFAFVAGRSPYETPNDQVDLKSGQSICAGVLFAGERGVVITGAARSAKMLRWDDVHDISRAVKCTPTKGLTGPPAGVGGKQLHQSAQ